MAETPTIISAAELERQNRQLQLTKDLTDSSKNLQEVLKSLSDSEGIARLEATLTADMSKIADSFRESAGAINRYIDEMFLNISQNREKLGTDLKAIAGSFAGAFEPTVENLRLFGQALDEVMESGKIGDFKNALTGLDFTKVITDQEALTAAIDKGSKSLLEKTKNVKEYLELLEEEEFGTENLKKKIEEATESITDEEEKYAKLIETLKNYVATKEDIEEFNNRAKINRIEDIALKTKETLELKKSNDELQIKAERETTLAKLHEINKRNTGESITGFKSLADSIFGASDKTSLLSKNLLMLVSAKDGLKGGLLGLGTAIKTGFVDSLFGVEAVINRLGGFINERIINSTFKFADAVAKLNRETGGMSAGFGGPGFAGGAGVKSFAAPGLATYGIGLDKYIETQGKLMNQFNQLATLTDIQQNKVIGNAAKLGNLGVQTETYGRILQGYFGAVGKTIDAADESVNKLAKDAIGMGLSVSQYLSKFEQLMPKIIAYGREASTIFRELTALSQATKGIVTEGDLASLADRFSTFDGAAEQVSKLNAMLGGTSIGLQDVMGKDPAEIAFAIKRATNEAGLNFDQLNRGYKQLLAELFGGDMQVAAAFYNANMAKANEMLAKGSASQEELNKKAEDSATAQQKLATALDNVRIAFTPMIDLVSMVADGFIWIQKNIGAGTSVFVGFMTLVGVAAGTWAAFRAAAVSAVASITTPLTQLSIKLDEIHGKLLRVKGAAAGTAGGVPPTTTGMGFGGRAMVGGLIASAVIGTIASFASTNSTDSDSEKRTYNAVVDKPISAPVGYDRKVSNTRTGDQYFVSNGDTLIGAQQGEKLYDRVFGSEKIKSDSSRFASSTRENNSSFFNNSLASFTSMFSSIGQTFAHHFVKETAEAAKSGDTTISNVFGGSRGDTHVHVVANLDGQNIVTNVQKRIVNDPRQIATAVMGYTTSKV
jgi:hypothetical protein